MDRLAEWAVDELVDKNLPPEQVQRARAAFEARKWYVSKIAPLRYGDKLQVNQEISGPGGGPLQVDVLVNMLLTPANLERLTDVEVESIRSAAAKLALPAPAPAADLAPALSLRGRVPTSTPVRPRLTSNALNGLLANAAVRAFGFRIQEGSR